MSVRKKLILRQLGTLAVMLSLWVAASVVRAAERWSAKLDGKVRFYQSTELGVLVVGTEKSLYAVDGETGDVLWRRKSVKLDETDVAPAPGTDMLLLTLDSGSKTRVEALDLMTGSALWRSDKVRGAVMQMALDQNANQREVRTSVLRAINFCKGRSELRSLCGRDVRAPSTKFIIINRALRDRCGEDDS